MRYVMRILKPAAVILSTLLAFGCASTLVRNAWRNPEAKPVSYKNVLALAIADQASNRRVMEDALVAHISSGSRARAVAAYSLLPDADVKDEARIRAAIAQAGADGLVVMRMVARDKETTYVPGQVYAVPVAYRGWWGYYRRVVPMSYAPGHYRTDEKVSLETMVFTVADEMLVWAGMSETTNPDSISTLTREVATAVTKDMQRRRLLR
jgi:hypothetical protein